MMCSLKNKSLTFLASWALVNFGASFSSGILLAVVIGIPNTSLQECHHAEVKYCGQTFKSLFELTDIWNIVHKCPM